MKIILDNGHGRNTAGKRSPDGQSEGGNQGGGEGEDENPEQGLGF